MSYVLETKHQPSHFGGSLRHKLAWFGGMVTAWPIPADYVCTLNNTPMLRKLHTSSGQCTSMCYGPEKVWSLDKWSSLLAFMGNFRLHPHVLPSELRSPPLSVALLCRLETKTSVLSIGPRARLHLFLAAPTSAVERNKAQSTSANIITRGTGTFRIGIHGPNCKSEAKQMTTSRVDSFSKEVLPPILD